MVSNELLVEMYRKMCLVRHHDIKVSDLKIQGKIKGSMHVMTGQEAIGVGVGAALEKDDYITSTHRGHGHVIGKGINLEKMAAEMCGKATGLSRGKAGHLLIAEKESGALGCGGIVGGLVPIAVGYAMAFKIKGSKQVSLAYFGDGASSTGSVHEAMNFACVRKYPVVFFCENNEYGLTCAAWKAVSVKDIADRAKGYGIPGVVIDGNDVISVYEATKEAVERARRGEGPTLIEAKTYRMTGSAAGAKTDYVPEEYFEEGAKVDPIEKFSKNLIEKGILTKKQADGIFEETRKYIDEIYEKALNDPDPTEDVFWSNVYAD